MLERLTKPVITVDLDFGVYHRFRKRFYGPRALKILETYSSNVAES